MKKIFKNIMMVAVGIVGVLQLNSCCSDNPNYWQPDSSVTKQYPPTSLEPELVDSASLDLSVKVGVPTSCKYIQLQISESPLTSNDNIAVAGDVYSFQSSENVDGDNSYTFKISHNNGKFVTKLNTTYYFRARCIGADGSVSNWYTNGMLYNGGISDAQLEQKLITNTLDTLKTPNAAWVDDAGIGEDELTVTYYVPTFAGQITSIYCEETGQSYSTAGDDPSADKVPLYKHTISGLTAGQTYHFATKNGDETVATCSSATELPVDMANIMQILQWASADVIGTAIGDAKTLTVNNPTFGDFKVVLNEDNSTNGGFTNTGSYKCWMPDNTVSTLNCRVQNKNRNTVDFICPSQGRIYIHGQGKSSAGTTYDVTFYPDDAEEGDDPIDLGQKTLYYAKTNNAQPYLKIKVSKPGRVHIAPTASSSVYFYGFSFAPGAY